MAFHAHEQEISHKCISLDTCVTHVHESCHVLNKTRYTHTLTHQDTPQRTHMRTEIETEIESETEAETETETDTETYTHKHTHTHMHPHNLSLKYTCCIRRKIIGACLTV